MDKNQATGLILMSILLVAYFWFFGSPTELPENADNTSQTTEVDSSYNKSTEIKSGENTSPVETVANDSLINEQLKSRYGVFAPAARGEEKNITVSTDVINLVFNAKGASIDNLELKDFKTFNQEPLILVNKEWEEKELLVNTVVGAVNINELYYELQNNPKTSLTEGDTVTYDFVADLGGGRKVIQSYTLSGNAYEVGYDVSLKGFQNELLGDQITLVWDKQMKLYEKDLESSRTKSTIKYYNSEDGVDDLGERSVDEETEELAIPINWVAYKQNFFTSALITDLPMRRAKLTTTGEGISDEFVKYGSIRTEIGLDEVKDNKASFKYYFGPNNYKILKKTAPDFEDNLNLGWFPISLVNKFVIINVFQFLEKYIANYGIIIIILVLLIKLALSPLSYKSYVSMAKTKVLKPQLDEIKEKHGGDMQKAQAEQMQLYQKVGVNPLSGCIPLLLQMPILFAMFYFFPSSIELRGQSFLWATDLSTYDSIASLPFDIPFYGDHVSLFTILMTASTLLITWSQGQVSSVQGPMKNVQYMMPIIFMFVLNSFPAALSFYYLIANLITFGQQTLIRRMIDEDKIKQILEENKKKNANKKTSKFQQRLQEAMKASEENKKSKNKK
ncbi:membrane protein insertase YidC [Marivirga atlantica]|jgi:YidC/Oxa1 family membrane protein insertase|uniref:Membrane protein insertase YidC n=1 Tax=Marivirga atlantica TaxID=1548457 RepID=A0A937ANY6_9BACT|nr:membrane protein insertase YidC [Marivirga atlantica]MBL0766167.1 membrane protein insertase YidC [Marivirga atlantica]